MNSKLTGGLVKTMTEIYAALAEHFDAEHKAS